MDSPPPEQARWFATELQPHEPVLRAYLQKQFPALHDVADVVPESHIRLWHPHRATAFARELATGREFTHALRFISE